MSEARDPNAPVVVVLNAHWTERWRSGGASRLAAEQWLRAFARNTSKTLQGEHVEIRAADGEVLVREVFPMAR